MIKHWADILTDITAAWVHTHSSATGKHQRIKSASVSDSISFKTCEICECKSSFYNSTGKAEEISLLCSQLRNVESLKSLTSSINSLRVFFIRLLHLFFEYFQSLGLKRRPQVNHPDHGFALLCNSRSCPNSSQKPNTSRLEVEIYYTHLRLLGFRFR